MNGYILELAKKYKIKSIAISHGTLAKSYNKYDELFQDLISEELISKYSTYFACQSKISFDFCKNKKLINKVLKTGNLIFSQSKEKRKKFILYAVTMRHFSNNHYYGIETFFEFYKNLEIFSQISKEKKINFLIKLHPNINYLKSDLEKRFSFLKFTTEPINKSLSKAYLTISFSSTAIEDSLYSNVPVILYDPNKRYMHCKSQSQTTKKNYAIYYSSDRESLLEAINTIKTSKEINFSEYTYQGHFNENIYKLISD